MSMLHLGLWLQSQPLHLCSPNREIGPLLHVQCGLPFLLLQLPPFLQGFGEHGSIKEVNAVAFLFDRITIKETSLFFRLVIFTLGCGSSSGSRCCSFGGEFGGDGSSFWTLVALRIINVTYTCTIIRACHILASITLNLGLFQNQDTILTGYLAK